MRKKSSASLRVGLLNRGLAQGALPIKFHIHKVNNKLNDEASLRCVFLVGDLLRVHNQ
jgi:hypothetical protein